MFINFHLFSVDQYVSLIFHESYSYLMIFCASMSDIKIMKRSVFIQFGYGEFFLKMVNRCLSCYHTYQAVPSNHRPALGTSSLCSMRQMTSHPGSWWRHHYNDSANRQRTDASRFLWWRHEGHLCVSGYLTDVTIMTVTLTAGQEVWHRLREATRPRPKRMHR